MLVHQQSLFVAREANVRIIVQARPILDHLGITLAPLRSPSGHRGAKTVTPTSDGNVVISTRMEPVKPIRDLIASIIQSVKYEPQPRVITERELTDGLHHAQHLLIRRLTTGEQELLHAYIRIVIRELGIQLAPVVD